jgi:transposase InsO family protein
MIAQLVHATSARLLARSKLAEFIPLFTERHVRGWLDEHPPQNAEASRAS